MVFNAFYEHDYHAGLVNFNSPHFTYNYKSIHHYCQSLLNKNTRNFKQRLTKRDLSLCDKLRNLHTGQCKRTGGRYNELVFAFFSTGGGVKGKKIYTC